MLKSAFVAITSDQDAPFATSLPTTPAAKIEAVSVQPSTATIVRAKEEEAPPPGAKNESNSSTGEATAEISSDPSGADIEIDGTFVGTTPSSMGVLAGVHTLRITKIGYKSWNRSLKSSTGKINVAVVLEPIPIGTSGNAHAPVEVAATSPIQISAPPVNTSEAIAEPRIGMWFIGVPTERHDGIVVSGVSPSGPADIVGIQPGDVILAIDAHFLYSINELDTEIQRHAPKEKLTIRFRHNEQTSEIKIVLGSK